MGDGAAEQTYSVYLPLVSRLRPEYTIRQTVFGVQMYESLNSPSARLDLAQQAGVSWIRWQLNWPEIEPSNTTPARFNWTSTDAALTAAARAGSRVILTMHANPSWAATYPEGRIDKVPLSEFAEFMSAAVERYDGDGLNDAPNMPVAEHFEFYNEPDCGLPRWGDNGAEYAQMLCAVAPAMKAANPEREASHGGHRI